ncbi:hypothetical protein [Microbacterium aurum]|uniref:hypothetical protein n=1 Tax=Microbacterium aurum TaxID=36805 RepID=UPI0018DD2263|nr:hypothetical protein [Microbacterium aurum]MBM7826634.1 hypothetical protein [Microbacterium aurum]
MSAIEAAAFLHVSQGHATQLMRSGTLAARQLPSGHWLTSEAALGACDAIMRRGHGRTLAPESAWGVLWELSGLHPHWLSSSTLSRLRAQLVEWRPEDIVRAVSSRTQETRYRSAAPGASSGLTLTGRRVASVLKVGLRSWTDVVAGYVPQGVTPEQHARRTGMTLDYEGMHTLYEWTLPVPYNAPRMPVAVVAADLARSHVTTERAKGVHALSRLRYEWARSR